MFYLVKNTDSVYLVHCTDEVRAVELARARALENESVWTDGDSGQTVSELRFDGKEFAVELAP
jgi:hypothetical protein